MSSDFSELLAQSNALCKNTLMETLNIEFVDVDHESITAKMPVNTRVFQPDGVLHGGATLALAESVGSAAAQIFLRRKDIQVRGIQLSGKHVKSVREGYVWAKASLVHGGRTTQLWEIRVVNDAQELVSLVKLTTMVLSQ